MCVQKNFLPFCANIINIMPLIKCALLLFCYHQLLGGAVSEFTPTVYPAKISSQCDQDDPLDSDEQLMQSLQQVKQQLPNQLFTNYPSCKSIYDADPSSSSGYYYMTIGNCSLVYCDMEGTNCGGEGGWTRVAYINMTQTGATCPVGLNQRSFNSKSYCGNTGPGCNGTMFPTLVVCVVGYVDTSMEHHLHLLPTISTLVAPLMITMLMECPLRMGVLHVNTSGHMLVHGMMLSGIMLVVHANNTLQP